MRQQEPQRYAGSPLGAAAALARPQQPQGAAAPAVDAAAAPAGAGAEDPPIPAALAALLHQSDRSGRQQFTSSPYGGGAAVNPNSPRTGAAAAPSPLNTSAVSLHTSARAGGGGGGAGGSSASTSSATVAASSPAAYHGSSSLAAAREEKKTWRLLTALTCCMGLGPSSPASSTPPAELQASSSQSPGSPEEDPPAAGGGGSSSSSSSSDGGGSSAGAGAVPALALPHTPANARRTAPSLDSSGNGTPSSGGFTPSSVLSPKNAVAAKRAQRQLAARASYDASASNMTPWGSRHPSVTRAAAFPPAPSLLSRLSASRSGHAEPSGGGSGGGGAGALGSPAPLPHPHANMGPSASPATPRQTAAVEFGNAQLGARAVDSPAALSALGMLNPHGNPKQRINNVRRGASGTGEGPLLAHLMPMDKGKPCLVLDLDETLVHSSFKPVPNADYVLPVEIEGVVHQVYVIKRPGCDEFLTRMGKLYEVVIFTASLCKYADPLLDLLDPENVMRARLFREACVFHEGNFVKDLSLIGRDPRVTIIVDNSPASFLFQPENAILCDTFIDNKEDKELWALADFLTALSGTEDVREGLAMWSAGTYRGPQSLRRRTAPRAVDSDGEGE